MAIGFLAICPDCHETCQLPNDYGRSWCRECRKQIEPEIIQLHSRTFNGTPTIR